VAFRRVISLAAAAATVLVLSAPAALAQEGPTITVEQAHPANTSVHYFVKLADGDSPVDGATVTATATSADGTAGQPVTLDADGDGIYQGSVELSESGQWTIAFAATNPTASLSYDQTMPGEPFDASDSKDSSPVFPLLFAAAFLVTLAGMGVWALMDKRRRPAEPETGVDTDADVETTTAD
jgi:hypothetical protein